MELTCHFQVNNVDVELHKNGVDGELICYTSENPFHIGLICHDKQVDEPRYQTSRKRSMSLDKSENVSDDNVRNINHKSSDANNTHKESRMRDLPQQNGKHDMKLGNVGDIKRASEGKRRRRSRFVEPGD